MQAQDLQAVLWAIDRQGQRSVPRPVAIGHTEADTECAGRSWCAEDQTCCCINT